MDNLTHTLTGLALSHAGLYRKTRFATLTLIVAANAPDVDMVSQFWGGASYLRHHRGITHSLLGITVLALLLAALIYYFGRARRAEKTGARPGPPLRFGWLFLLAWIGTASHLLLDFTNAYGVRPFLPFSGRWYAWDIMFIFDPLLLALLCLGLGLPALLRLVSEEVGARQSRPAWGAVFALCAMVMLWGLRDAAHRRVLGFLEGHTYFEESPLRVGAFPSPLNPFEWTGVVETGAAYDVLPASALAGDVDPRAARQFHKPEASPVLDAALNSRTGRIFMNFARFPWAEIEDTEQGFEVEISDLRFYSEPGGRRFVADITLDSSRQVRAESFSFAAPANGARAR